MKASEWLKQYGQAEAKLSSPNERYMKNFATVMPPSKLLILALVALTSGCTTPINTDYKPGVDFSKYRTFALLPLPQRGSIDDPGLVLRLAEPARDAVKSALATKGLTEVPTDKADLAVNLRGQSLPKVEVKDYGFSYPVMTRYGMATVVQNPHSSVSTYNERTLIIELLDNRSKELVWVGWLKKQSSNQVQAKDLQQAIQEILAKFPPPPAEASR